MSFGSNSQQTARQFLGPALSWKETQRWSVDESSLIVRILQDFQQVWVIVSQWHRGDLSVDIKQDVAIHINNVVSDALVVIGKIDDCVGKLDVVQLCNHFFGFRAWDWSLDTGTGRLTQYEI